MNIHGVSPATSTNHTEATAKVAAKPDSSTPEPTVTASGATDTVSISNAAKAAVEEATETAAQTVQEARHGDHQAQRLLAKEEAKAK